MEKCLTEMLHMDTKPKIIPKVTLHYYDSIVVA